MLDIDIWVIREQGLAYDPTNGRDLTGYHVEALDGSIGKIDKASNDVGQSYIIVDTGPWIFGKKVMLPAGVIERIDDEDERVWVDRTKTRSRARPSSTSRCSRTRAIATSSARTTARAAAATANTTRTDRCKSPPAAGKV